MLGLAALGADPLLHSPRESSRRGAHVLQARATRPHLIVTLVDDVGYNDVGWRNGDVKTPFLDSLLRSQSEQTVELLRRVGGLTSLPLEQLVVATLGSPKEYAYRTKLTPHYRPGHGDGAPTVGFVRRAKGGGRDSMLDVKSCAIASAEP